MTRKEAQRRLAAAIREQQAVQKEVREANAHVVEATRKLPPYYVNKRFAEGERERIQKLIDHAQRASDRLGAATADVVNLRSLVSTQQVQKALPGPRHHATKKPPAQLQREIDEALAFRPDRGVLGEPRSSSRDVTVELLRDASYGPGENVQRVASAKPARDVEGSPTLVAALERLRSQYDRTMGFISKPLAYSNAMPHSKREHANLIRLIKGGYVKVREVKGPPPDGSIARRDSPYGNERYYELYLANGD